jgi:hypothetical protein
MYDKGYAFPLIILNHIPGALCFILPFLHGKSIWILASYKFIFSFFILKNNFYLPFSLDHSEHHQFYSQVNK